MNELRSAESFNAMRCADFAVIVFAPRWSVYALRAEVAFQSIVPDLERTGVQVFVAIEDDPRENPYLAEWIDTNRQHFDGLIGLGSGELVLSRKGKPFHTQHRLHAARMSDVYDRLLTQLHDEQ